MRDTIDMAREAGFPSGVIRWKDIKAFEALVRADAIADEREACAKVCDARYMGDNNREDTESRRCAEAIRARGNT
jgi:hypothetical protein